MTLLQYYFNFFRSAVLWPVLASNYCAQSKPILKSNKNKIVKWKAPISKPYRPPIPSQYNQRQLRYGTKFEVN